MPSSIDEAVEYITETLSEEYGITATSTTVRSIAERVCNYVKRHLGYRYFSRITTVSGESEYDAPAVDITGASVTGGRLVRVYYSSKDVAVFEVDIAGSVNDLGNVSDEWATALGLMLQNLQQDIINRAAPMYGEISRDGSSLQLHPAPAIATDYAVLMERDKEDSELSEDDWMAIIWGALSRHLKSQASSIIATGGFRAGSYAVTNVGKANDYWNGESVGYSSMYNDYLDTGASAEVITA